MKNTLKHLMTSSVLVAGIAGFLPAAVAADGSDPVSKLLTEARTESSQISVDWKSYTRQSNLNWTSDAAETARMKEDVGAASKTIAGLKDSRTQASPSQLATIERILPVLEEIAENSANAVQFLNKSQSRLSGKDYKAYLDSNADTSTRLANLVAQLVDFANSRDKFEIAKRNLELASK
jgi:hypothetical protein